MEAGSLGLAGSGTLRFLRGRWERLSAEVGMDSGPGADILAVLAVVRLEEACCRAICFSFRIS